MTKIYAEMTFILLVAWKNIRPVQGIIPTISKNSKIYCNQSNKKNAG